MPVAIVSRSHHVAKITGQGASKRWFPINYPVNPTIEWSCNMLQKNANWSCHVLPLHMLGSVLSDLAVKLEHVAFTLECVCSWIGFTYGIFIRSTRIAIKCREHGRSRLSQELSGSDHKTNQLRMTGTSNQMIYIYAHINMYRSFMSGALAQAGVVAKCDVTLLMNPFWQPLLCAALLFVKPNGQRARSKHTCRKINVLATADSPCIFFAYVEFLDQADQAWHAAEDWVNMMKSMTFSASKRRQTQHVCIFLSCLRIHAGRLLDITGECGIFPCP